MMEHSSFGRPPYRRSEEFQEEDVWNVIMEDEDEVIGFKNDERNADVATSPLSITRRLPSAVRMIPGTNKRRGQDSSDEPKLVQHSAPVSIPDWSKIYGKNPKMKVVVGSSSISSQERDSEAAVHDGADESDEDLDDDDDDDSGDRRRLHSHEWLAKKFARSQISTFSVCEGAGRTLKGRDLSRVRNAVLSKTGFI